jgi:hypothetical protein
MQPRSFYTNYTLDVIVLREQTHVMPRTNVKRVFIRRSLPDASKRLRNTQQSPDSSAVGGGAHLHRTSLTSWRFAKNCDWFETCPKFTIRDICEYECLKRMTKNWSNNSWKRRLVLKQESSRVNGHLAYHTTKLIAPTTNLQRYKCTRSSKLSRLIFLMWLCNSLNIREYGGLY